MYACMIILHLKTIKSIGGDAQSSNDECGSVGKFRSVGFCSDSDSYIHNNVAIATNNMITVNYESKTCMAIYSRYMHMSIYC